MNMPGDSGPVIGVSQMQNLEGYIGRLRILGTLLEYSSLDTGHLFTCPDVECQKIGFDYSCGYLIPCHPVRLVPIVLLRWAEETKIKSGFTFVAVSQIGWLLWLQYGPWSQY